MGKAVDRARIAEAQRQAATAQRRAVSARVSRTRERGEAQVRAAGRKIGR